MKVSWSVRPRVLKVNAESVGLWCQGNLLNEDHAHGVRNLVAGWEREAAVSHAMNAVASDSTWRFCTRDEDRSHLPLQSQQ
jgi:hypothetical protein